jgi:hypothetical protein
MLSFPVGTLSLGEAKGRRDEAGAGRPDPDRGRLLTPKRHQQTPKRNKDYLFQIADQLEPKPVYGNVNKAGALDYRR